MALQGEVRFMTTQALSACVCVMSSHLVHVLSCPAEGGLDGLPHCLLDSPGLLSVLRTCLIPPAIPGPFAGCKHLHISLLTVQGFDRKVTA